MSWKKLGSVPPTQLVEARLQLHHAAQIVAAAGKTFLPPQPDDSQPNMAWDEQLTALLGRSLATSGVRAGLRFPDLSLLLVDADGGVADQFELHDRTLEDGYAWLTEAATRAGEALPGNEWVRAEYELPEHAAQSGAAFSSSDAAARAELALWFANAQNTIEAATAQMPGASEVRCWPHHFDVGALVAVAERPDGGLAKSIGIGMSPGDGSYAEPYWYVSPWPYPEASALASLDGGGHWHTEGFTSAIFTGSRLLEGHAGRQSDRLDAFLGSAIAASSHALGE